MKAGAMFKTLNFGLMTLCVMTSCRSFTPESKEQSVADVLPESYAHIAQPERINPDMRWWNNFSDTNITRIITLALSDNLTIRQADARLRAAEAVAIQRGATRLPDLSISGGASRSRQLSPAADGNITPKNTENYSASAISSYELDLWGRVRAGQKSAQKDLEATRSDLETAAMTIAAETTIKYIDLMQQREKIDIIQEQKRMSESVLELIELRYRKSQASALDVYQQKEALARINTLIPPAEALEQSIMHELTVLLGMTLNADTGINGRQLPETTSLPQPGIPADILSRRPDVKAARMRLKVAEWQVSAAIADRLPTIRLSASAGYQTDNMANIFDNWISNIAASLTGPVFDGHRRRAEVDRTKAVADQLLAAYHETVLKAATEVQNAITQETSQMQLINALEEQLNAADDSFSEALSRYNKGAESYLPVLTTEISRQNIQLSLVQARHDRIVWRIRLYRALGGDWKSILEKGIN